MVTQALGTGTGSHRLWELVQGHTGFRRYRVTQALRTGTGFGTGIETRDTGFRNWYMVTQALGTGIGSHRLWELVQGHTGVRTGTGSHRL